MAQKIENKYLKYLPMIMILAVFLTMVPIAYNEIVEARGFKENHCLEEEQYYYRLEGWFLFLSKIETTEENSDGVDYRCTKWEEEPMIGKTIMGQELIHDKGRK